MRTFGFGALIFVLASSAAQRKNVHKQRLPPRGSWRRRRLKENARLSFSCCFWFWQKFVNGIFLKLEAIAESMKQNQIRNPQKGKTTTCCRLSVSRAPSVTLARDTFLPEEGLYVYALRCLRRKMCRFLVLKSWKFPLLPLRHKAEKSHRLMAPLCKGSSREAGEGLFGKHQICKNSFAVVRHKPAFCRTPTPLSQPFG